MVRQHLHHLKVFIHFHLLIQNSSVLEMTFISALTTATVALIASVLNCRFGWYADPRTVLAARADQRTAFWGQEENGLKKGVGENAAEPGGH